MYADISVSITTKITVSASVLIPHGNAIVNRIFISYVNIIQEKKKDGDKKRNVNNRMRTIYRICKCRVFAFDILKCFQFESFRFINCNKINIDIFTYRQIHT